MKERPILYCGQMVRKILADQKTHTRRIVKSEHLKGSTTPVEVLDLLGSDMLRQAATLCPYGVPGDRLWVRETFKTVPVGNHFVYRADEPTTNAQKTDHAFGPWKPSIFMPRKASRITLEIVAVRVERLQDISEADAIAEGVQFDKIANRFPVPQYKALWESINGKGSWDKNPWVWVIEFKKL